MLCDCPFGGKKKKKFVEKQKFVFPSFDCNDFNIQ